MCLRGAIPLLVVVLGCSGTQPAAHDQAELDNVARCFHTAVTLLQDQPESPDKFASFLATAAHRVTETKRDTGNADFGALRWDAAGESLITASGESITCRLAGQTHDNYAPQGTAWIIEYELVVPGTELRSRTTIDLHMD